MSGPASNHNVFVIPDIDNTYIVYLPIHGILFKGNAASVNLFHKALSGDKVALSRFGMTEEQARKLTRMNNNRSPESNPKVQFNPTTVSLFLTSDCSMKCAYCYASAGENHTQIKKEYIEVAINEVVRNAQLISNKSISVNYHGGGDIGVVWNLVEQTTEYVSKLARENNIKVNFSAGLNGVLTDSQRRWLVGNIHSATVSIDGYKEIQDSLRPLKNGESSFDIVHKTLKYFDSQGFSYAIRSTVTAETVAHLEEIVKFFYSNYKVRKIKLEPVFIQGRASENKVSPPQTEEFVTNFIRAKRAAESNNVELLYSGARFDFLSNKFCMAAGSSFGVTPEGYITSCYEVLDKKNPVSEIFFYGKIENREIHIDQEKLRNLTKLTVFNKEKCQQCFAKFHCAGDCPVKSILSEQTDDLQDYRCIINRELTKYQLLDAIE